MQDVIQRDEPDLRVYAITPETARLLDRARARRSPAGNDGVGADCRCAGIGVWQHVLAARATPFVHMQARERRRSLDALPSERRMHARAGVGLSGPGLHSVR